MKNFKIFAMLVFIILAFGISAMAQNVTVNPGAGSYPDLTSAFNAINAGTHTGAITVDIVNSTTEPGSAVLNSSGAGSASYTSVLIRPTSDGLTISGATVTGRGLIELNGADNVTINGDNPNTAGTNRNLTITNTAAVTVNLASVIRIAVLAAVPSADNNSFINLNLNGNGVGRNAAANTSTTNSENSSFGIYAGGLATAPTTAPGPLTSVSTNTAASGTTINAFNASNNAVNACARAIFFNGAAASVSTGVTVSNNTVGGAGANSGAPPYTTPATTVYTKGIFIAGTTVATVTGNTLQNIMSYVATAISAIEFNSAIGAGPHTISDNTVNTVAQNLSTNGNQVAGITVLVSTGPYTISRNTVTNIQGQGTSGTTNDFGISVVTTATSGLIERNNVTTVYNRNTNTAGVSGINVNGGNNVTVRNNFVSDINQNITGGVAFNPSFGTIGIRMQLGTGHKVYHNSVNLFGAALGSGSSILTAAFTINATTQTGIDVRNNIFSNTMTGGTTSIAHVSIFLPTNAATAMSLTLNNNDYFSGTVDPARQGIAQAGTTPGTGFYLASNFNAAVTTPATNLRALTTTLGPATNDNASKVVDPLFVSSTDLHIAVGSPMVDAGDASVGVTNDIDGQLRVAAPDIGADEPSGVTPPANDIGATAFISPVNGGTVATGAAFAPQASFTNNGTATQTSVTVRYRILDGALVEVCNVTAVIPSISPGQTITVTFPTCTIAAAGTYSIRARAELVGDANTANDEIIGTLNAVAPLTGAYTVGTGGNFTSLTNAGGIFQALNAAGATGNVTINITTDLTGETGENALNELAGGFTVLIKPSGAPRSITGNSTTAVPIRALIRINGADNVTIDGSLSGANDRSLTITNNDTALTSGVVHFSTGTNGAQNDTIRNVIVIGSSSTTGTLTGISFGGNTAPNSLGADNDNKRIINCDIRRVLWGILSLGASAANKDTGAIIAANALNSAAPNNIGQLGIGTAFDDGTQIVANSIDGIISAGSFDSIGISLGGLVGVSTATTTGGSETTNAIVSRNYIGTVTNSNTFSAFGILIAPAVTGTNRIDNNMITGVQANGTSGDFTAGIYLIDSGADSTTQFYYNSVSMSGTVTGGDEFSYALAVNGTDPAIVSRNNIFMNTQSNGTTANSYAIGLGYGTFANYDSNFNDLFTTTGATFFVGRTGSIDNTGTATNHAALAAFQTAVTDEANSVSLNPSFTSPTNLHLNLGSPVQDLGTPIAAVPKDFDLQTRGIAGPPPPFASQDDSIGGSTEGAGNTDIGADEILAPNSANVSVGGRVVMADGQTGISRVWVTLSGGDLTQPIVARTSPFGYYSFDGLQVGQTYILTVASKRYTFVVPTVVITPDDNIQNADFTANPLQ
ncbi:MAG: hypothetical protein ABWZ66_10710 [Pyrinomonadaceae bacterium]